MKIETYSLGQLSTNCYLVYDETTYEAVVIDPADEGGFLSEEIQRLQLIPVAFILTHGHFDHILGLLELKLNFPNVPSMMHEADKFLVESVQSRAKHWLKVDVDPAPPINQHLTDGQVIKFGEESLKILHAPGHTPGSVCLYNDQAIFTGDILFPNDTGRTDFSYSNPSQMKESLRKVRKLAQSREMYAGH